MTNAIKRSINLALSHRGMCALRAAGLFVHIANSLAAPSHTEPQGIILTVRFFSCVSDCPPQFCLIWRYYSDEGAHAARSKWTTDRAALRRRRSG